MKEEAFRTVERLIRTREYFLRSTYQLLYYLKARYSEPDKQELIRQMESIKLLLLDSDFIRREQSGIKYIEYLPALIKHVDQIENIQVGIEVIDHEWVRLWLSRRKSYISKCHAIIKDCRADFDNWFSHCEANRKLQDAIDNAEIFHCLPQRVWLEKKESGVSFDLGFTIELGLTISWGHKINTLFKRPGLCKSGLRPIQMNSVSFSAIAPASMIRGESTILRIIMYEEEYRNVVERAKESFGINVQESESSSLLVEDNTEVRIKIESSENGIWFDSDEERGLWLGKYLQFQFMMRLSTNFEARCVPLRLLVYFNGVLSTTLKLIVQCSSENTQIIIPKRHDIMSAFISYARSDIEEVSLLVNGMEKVRPDLDIFMDVDSLRSGENWKEAIQHELQQRDILYLCWSSNAKRSKWVDFEWRYIYQNRGSEFVDPIPLESPEYCPPPTELEHKHFNDRWIKYRDRYANEFIRIKDCESGEISVFHKRTVVVGRAADADFQIKSSSVSGNHLRITSNSDNSFFVTDMNSVTGSFVGGKKLDTQPVGTSVDRGTEIVVGDRTIQIL